MRLLLDTYAVLWAMRDSPRLSASARAATADPANRKIVRAVSAFEIATKHRIGKLPEVAVLLPEFVAALARLDVTFLAISVDHATLAGALDRARQRRRHPPDLAEEDDAGTGDRL